MRMLADNECTDIDPRTYIPRVGDRKISHSGHLFPLRLRSAVEHRDSGYADHSDDHHVLHLHTLAEG
jgi:hypothetical protein